MRSNILGWVAVLLYAGAEALSIRSLVRPRAHAAVPALLACGLVFHFADLQARARAIGSVPYRTLSGSMLLFGWMLALACLALLLLHGERSIGPFLIPAVPALLAAGLLFHFFDLQARARALGSVPYRTLSGSMLLFGWMLALACLALLLVHRERSIGPFLIPFVLLFSVAGILLPLPEAPATPDTRGALFALHVTLAILAYAAFTFSFVLSLLYLLQNRQIREARTGLLFARLPALDVIGRMNRTSVTIGTAALAVSVLLGAIWAQKVWHSVADPKLAWAITTLLLYGFLLWMDRRGWEGRRVALLSMLGFAVMIFSYTFVNLYTSTEHVFR